MPKTGWPIVNNEYLELLSETGIVGFTGFDTYNRDYNKRGYICF